jgi:hypothetical protein
MLSFEGEGISLCKLYEEYTALKDMGWLNTISTQNLNKSILGYKRIKTPQKLNRANAQTVWYIMRAE